MTRVIFGRRLINHPVNGLLLVILLLVISGCVTQKRRSDVSKLGMLYHNTTAEFNGYFNANVLLEESTAKLNQQVEDDYNKLLPLYPYAKANNPKAVAGDLDEAIKKVGVVVAIHRVSHWTDDCYLLLGKAQYLKQTYEEAEETFEWFKDEFDPTIDQASRKVKKAGKKSKKQRVKERKVKTKERKQTQKSKKKEREKALKERKKQAKKRKKEREKNQKLRKKGKKPISTDKKTKEQETKVAESEEGGEEVKPEEPEKLEEERKDGMFDHRPVYQDGLLWLARVYIARDDYYQARYVLDQIENKPWIYDEVADELPIVNAHYYLEQGKFADAIPHMEKGIDRTKDKETKARYTFLLGQLYQIEGNKSGAAMAFKEAQRLSNNYDMVFSAQMNLIKSDWKSGTKTAEQTRQSLRTMLKDDKNRDYRDQIYFALAEIELEEGNESEAIALLQDALKTSTKAGNKKGGIYLKLGDLFYDKSNFVSAKLYYDSTLQILSATEDDYPRIKRRRDNLKEIADNILLVQNQDSLLQLASMDDEERKAYAQKVLQEEEEKKRLEILAKAENARNAETNNRRGGGKPSTFFAYNDKDLKRGKRDFEQRWGDRPLEDDWRRSNKRTSDQFALNDSLGNTEVTGIFDDKELEKVLSDIPFEEQKQKEANKKIETALFELGQLYRDRLQRNDLVVETLEELIRRYPDSKYMAEAYYTLYVSHQTLGNQSLAQTYYDKLIRDFPDSDFALALSDPDYLNAEKRRKESLVKYYNDTYATFQQGNHKEVVERAAKAPEKFGSNNTMQAKFALLTAMSTGNLQGKEAYVKGLKKVIASYPNTPEQVRAREILRLLNGTAGNEEAPKKKIDFKSEPNTVHYVIVQLVKNSIPLSNAKNSIADYNLKFHNLDRLRISNIYLGAKTQSPIVVIRRFKDQAEAMDYYDGVQKNIEEFLPEKADYTMYAISQRNYRETLKAKSLSGYDDFFQDFYLK